MTAVHVGGAIALAYWGVAVALAWLLEGVSPRGASVLSRLVQQSRGRAAHANACDGVLLELELARITARLHEEYASREPARAERTRVWILAYDRVLLELCESDGLPAPRAVPPLSRTERFALESALLARGRSW